jgi:hypothetical protein
MLHPNILRTIAANNGRPAPTPIKRGDIRRAEANNISRLVYVRSVNHERKTAIVTLIHPYTEMAVGSDEIISRNDTELTYDVVIPTALVGPIHLRNLGPELANIPDDTPRHRGAELRGVLDSRLVFREAEVAETLRLCADAIAEAFSDDE